MEEESEKGMGRKGGEENRLKDKEGNKGRNEKEWGGEGFSEICYEVWLFFYPSI